MENLPSSTINFLHLSDIHFRSGMAGSTADLDKDVRNELEIDLAQVVGKTGNAKAVLVSGDVGYSGKRDEYEYALEWLGKIVEVTQTAETEIFSVPGNHDIDWNYIENNPLLLSLHQDGKPTTPDQVNSWLATYAYNEASGNTLYGSVGAYNDYFAKKFGCDIHPSKPYWTQDVELSAETTLKIQGINSTLLSYKDTPVSEHKLVVGDIQSAIHREENKPTLVMCHHPMDWILDGDQVSDFLNSRSVIQLYGHKHRQRVNFLNFKSLVLVAGATHPERKESDWTPTYNYLQLWEGANDEGKTLEINIYTREWYQPDTKFRALLTESGEDYQHYSIQLPKQNSTNGQNEEPAILTTEDSLDAVKPQTDEPVTELETAATPDKTTISIGPSVNHARQLVYYFQQLDLSTQLELIGLLGLIAEEDRDEPLPEIFRKAFIRARVDRKLEELWTVVNSRLGIQQKSANPFMGR